MDPRQAMERTSLIIAGVTLVFSFFLFFSQSDMFVGSLFAALMSAGLAWLTYVVIKMIVLAFTK